MDTLWNYRHAKEQVERGDTTWEDQYLKLIGEIESQKESHTKVVAGKDGEIAQLRAKENVEIKKLSLDYREKEVAIREQNVEQEVERRLGQRVVDEVERILLANNGIQKERRGY